MPSLQNQDGSISSLKSLTVQIVGHKRPSISFHISLSDLRRREEEMKQTAHQFQIPPSRWKASRLYQASRQQKQKDEQVIRFDPEHDIVLQNYSFAMDWHPWLTTLLASYYQTGQLRVSDECQGSDLLLALEYFGILYAPGQLVFATHAAYQRVRCWSDYLTHRTALADGIAKQVQELQATVQDPQELLEHVLFYGTVTNVSECIEAAGRKITSWGAYQDEDAVCSIIHYLFNTSENNRVAASLREDFCIYLQNLFVDEIGVTFAVKKVDVCSHRTKVPTNQKIERAILKVEFIVPTEESEPDEPSRRESSKETNLDHTHRQPKSEENKQQKTNEDKPASTQGGANKRRSTSEGSPIDVTKDIYAPNPQKEKRGRKKDPLKILAPEKSTKTQPTATRAKTSRQITQKSASGGTNGDDFYQTGIRNTSANKSVSTRQRSIDPIFTAAVHGWHAPVEIIDAYRLENQTVVSAITGPGFPSDESFSIDTQGMRAQALRHEWVQGSLLNRDIGKHMKRLLSTDEEDVEEGVDGSSTPLYSDIKQHKIAQEEERELDESLKGSRNGSISGEGETSTWDWISTVCQGSICDIGGCDSPQRKSWEEEDDIHSPIQWNNSSPGDMPQHQKDPNTHHKVIPPQRINSGNATLVKDRLSKVQQYRPKSSEPRKVRPAPAPSVMPKQVQVSAEAKANSNKKGTIDPQGRNRATPQKGRGGSATSQQPGRAPSSQKTRGGMNPTKNRSTFTEKGAKSGGGKFSLFRRRKESAQ